jgi:hypothetical protein
MRNFSQSQTKNTLYFRLIKAGDPDSNAYPRYKWRVLRDRDKRYNAMIRSKSNGQANVRELYIFYICLALVLAVAMFGIVSDMITGR